ncbi:transposase [Streptomyces malaysiensis]|uniref:transposase n=1 Tax=Streptomyces malaysiensis TaxID=92644 RepID=UPI0028169F27|nr:transposase [Streptomyces samsunensis]
MSSPACSTTSGIRTPNSRQYARRWEIELVFDEIKTHQRGRPVLRSQTPDGVRQEIYAHLIVHHATRELLNEAARLHQSVAERTSFT